MNKIDLEIVCGAIWILVGIGIGSWIQYHIDIGIPVASAAGAIVGAIRGFGRDLP